MDTQITVLVDCFYVLVDDYCVGVLHVAIMVYHSCWHIRGQWLMVLHTISDDVCTLDDDVFIYGVMIL
jgi:hypothetical protein